METFTSTQEPTAGSTVTSTPTSPTTTESATTDSEVSTTLPASTSEALVTPTVEITETTLDSTIATSTIWSPPQWEVQQPLVLIVCLRHIKRFGAVLDIGLESVNDTCL